MFNSQAGGNGTERIWEEQSRGKEVLTINQRPTRSASQSCPGMVPISKSWSYDFLKWCLGNKKSESVTASGLWRLY
jgi:hypothetical protein